MLLGIRLALECSEHVPVRLLPDLWGRLRPTFIRTRNLDFRGFGPKQNLNIKGWNSHVHRESPRHFESTNLSRRNLSREIERTFSTCARLLTEDCAGDKEYVASKTGKPFTLSRVSCMAIPQRYRMLDHLRPISQSDSWTRRLLHSVTSLL